MQLAVEIGGQGPKEEMLRLEERPRIRIGLRDPDQVGSDQAGAELVLRGLIGKFL